MEKIFTAVYTYFKANKVVFYGLLLSILVLLGLGASRLKIEEDVTKMMPNAGKASEILHTLQDSKLSEKVVFLILKSLLNFLARLESTTVGFIWLDHHFLGAYNDF